MDGNSEQLQVINLKQLPIIEERLRDVKAKIEQRTSAVMALAVTEETRTDVKKIRTEVRKELEGYEAQRVAVKKAIMTPYEQFEAVYKECVSNPYKAADEALGKKIADVEVGIKQQKEDDVRAFFNELTSGFGLDWLKFEQLNLKVTLTCTPKAIKAAITQSVTKIVRDCAALEENPDRDEIMVEYQKSLDLGSACQIVQQIIAALNAARARNLALVSGDKRHALLHERNRIRRLHIAHKEVKAGLTAHRTAVDDLIGKLRVACIRCKQVLERMPRRRLDVRARIRVHHADVIGGDVTVDTRGIHTRLQFVMVYFKAGNSFHAFASLSIPRNRSSVRYSRQSRIYEIKNAAISAIGNAYHTAFRPNC